MPPILSLNEQRILGCLLEKEALTPDSYPLTLNSLRLACNQKTSREPVLDLDEGAVSAALNGLKGRDLVFTRTDGRATRYNHTLEKLAALDQAQRAVLTLLLLRGPQTAGELRGRSERLHEFQAPAEAEDALARLTALSGGPWVQRLARRPGEKEARWAHLLGGDVTEEEVQQAESLDRLGELERRVQDLEREVAAMRFFIQNHPLEGHDKP
jgi:uncharacterized protein YceH (UPF0502 family)